MSFCLSGGIIRLTVWLRDVLTHEKPCMMFEYVQTFCHVLPYPTFSCPKTNPAWPSDYYTWLYGCIVVWLYLDPSHCIECIRHKHSFLL